MSRGLPAWPLVLLVGGAVVLTSRRSSRPAGARVFFRERAAGTHPRVRELLDAWEREGSFDVLVAPGGGMRSSLSDSPYPTEAKTLQQTAHGRGAALDVWPVQFAGYVNGPWSAVPDFVRAQFVAFHDFAEARGFDHGRNWRTPNIPNGDWPHVELRGWRALPFPPPKGGYA